MKKRIKVQVHGTHTLLPVVMQHFIDQGMEITEELPNFHLVGSGPELEVHTLHLDKALLKGVPGLILSSDKVYTCLDSSLRVASQSKMREEDALIVPSTLEYSTLTQARAIYAEAHCKSLFGSKTIIVRPFGVYGPQIPDTIIAKLSNLALHKKPLVLYKPEHRKRTFLYIDDFLECIDKLVFSLLKGQQGLFNVGSEDAISVVKLADSIHQFINKTQDAAPVVLEKKDYFIDFWKIPDITRVKAVTRWRPRTSIRNGIWRNLGLLESEIGLA